MEMLIDWLQMLGIHTLGSLWIPVVAWTLLAGLLHVGIRRSRRMHPLVKYHVLRALYWALPLGILLAGLIDISDLWTGVTGAPVRRTTAGPGVWVGWPTAAASTGGSGATAWNLFHAAGLLTAIALAVALWRLFRLGSAMMRLQFVRRKIEKQRGSEFRQALRRMRRELGIEPEVRLLVGPDDAVPMTFGLKSPAVVIPRAVARSEERLRMTLIHELTHVRRGDYLQQCLEQFNAVLFAIHPLAVRLQREIGLCREMVCDGEVLEQLSCSPKRYAQFLYEMAAADGREGGAVALTENGNSLKRRIEAMRDFNFSFDSQWNPKRIGLVLGGLLLACAVFVVACSEIAGPQEPALSVDKPANRTDGAIFVAVERMPQLKGGLEALQEEITYPEEAREAGVEGTVVVQFVVDERGNVVDPVVLKGPEGGLSEEALRVVKQAKFEPGGQRGKPVPVRMSIPIRFTLDDGQAAPSGSKNSDTFVPDPSGKRSEVSVTGPSEGPNATASELGRVSGSVRTADGQPLPGVNVWIPGTTQGAVTDPSGTFAITGVSPGNHNVRFSYMGYLDVIVQNIDVAGGMTTTVNAKMEMQTVGLQGISVRSGRNENER